MAKKKEEAKPKKVAVKEITQEDADEKALENSVVRAGNIGGKLDCTD